MIATIAAKEFRELVRDGRFRWSAVVVGSLLIVAALAGWTAWRTQAQARDVAQATMQEMWFNQPAKNPHSAAHYGLWAFKPQMPLGFIDRGVDPYTGTASWLEAHRQNEFRFRPAMDATAAQRFGEWTTAGVLQLLVPLLIILLAHAAFAGERERGTLRQLASLGVPARTLVVGKAVGIGGAMGLLLVPVAAVGAALVMWDSGADGLFRMLALGGVYLAYFALVLALTLFVSARAATARGALIVLLSLWAWNGLVAPRLAADMARAVAPTPTARAFSAEVQRSLANGVDGHSPASARNRALQDSLLQAHGVSHVDSLPFNYSGYSMQRGEEHANDVFDHHFGLLWAQYAAQDRAQLAGAVIAPLIAVRQLSMAIAGTDFAQHRAFADAAESYRRLLNKSMNDAIAEHAAPGEAFSYMGDSTLWAEVGPFEYEAPSLGRVLLAQGPSLLFLTAWLLTLVVTVRRERRLSVL
jgi:ABC-2 type transport system permease protein